jgi:hypothetical protein
MSSLEERVAMLERQMCSVGRRLYQVETVLSSIQDELNTVLLTMQPRPNSQGSDSQGSFGELVLGDALEELISEVQARPPLQ